MKIYTSYWAQVRNFPTNLIGLNTTVWPPKYRPLGQDKRGVWVIDCPPLKPGRECEGLCRGPTNCFTNPTNCQFLSTYYKQLMTINIDKFFNILNRLHKQFCEDCGFNDVDFALIVFEAPKNKCSERIPLQNWLHFHNIEVEEWHK